MTKKVYIDFESRSQIDIWSAGAYRYAEDRSTEVLCLSYAVDTGKVHTALKGLQLMTMVGILNDLVLEGAEFHAHNAFFERCMWKFCLTPKYGAFPIPLQQWRCTAAKASVCSLPRSLEKVAMALGTKTTKDMEGNRVMRALCTTTGPIEASKLVRLGQYCEKDVETEREVDQMLPDLIPDEQAVWFLDQAINDRGVKVDLDAVHKAIKLIETDKETLTKELKDISGGEIDKGTQTAVIKRYLEKRGLNLPNLQKATLVAALQKADPEHVRIIQLRQQLSLTSNAKYASMAYSASKDERLRDTLMYHGASTGRWSGKIVQLQNLVKPTITGSQVDTAIECLKDNPTVFPMFYHVLPVLSSCIRGMLIPTEGYEMFTADYASIEARVVMWLADEKKGVKIFVDQDKDPEAIDIYVYMARSIFGNNKLTKKDKKERQLGKQAVLGCGFGMGVAKFIATCAKYNVEVTDQLAEKAVKTYRRTFNGVPNFWYALEAAVKKAVSLKVTVPFGKLKIASDAQFLTIQLPSGRKLYYHKPRVTSEGKLVFKSVNSKTKQYSTEETWGGKLAENVTQAVARDLMVHGMFNLKDKGYEILFTVHDELVVEGCSKKEQDVIDLVCHKPTWAEGCPVAAECEKIKRYKK